MRFRNDSSLDTTELRSLADFALGELDHRGVFVYITDPTSTRYSWRGKGGHKNWRGYPQWLRRECPSSCTYMIWGYVFKNDFPINTYLGTEHRVGEFYIIPNWQTLMVGLIAHEGIHVEAAREGLRQSEWRANKYSLRMMKRYEDAS